MENTLQQYVNRKDLKESVGSLEVIQGTAKDSGNIYYCLEIQFINGFSKRLFLNSAEIFAVVNSFEQLDSQKQVEVNFQG